MNSYHEELYEQVRASAWAGSEWLATEAKAVLASIETTQTKLGIIRRARDAGVTWPGLAQSIGYGADQPPDEMDWVRAGKALQAWFANHDSEEAQETRSYAGEAAREDLERAMVQSDTIDDYAESVTTQVINEEIAAEAHRQ